MSDQTEPTDIQEDAIAWLIKLRSSQLSPLDRHQFAQWLSEDAAHSLAFAEAEALFDEMADAGQRLRGRSAVADRRNPHRATTGPDSNRRPSIGFAWIIAPAAVAALWLVAVLTVLPAQFHALDAWFSDYHTGTSEWRSITLSDGSEVLLNTHSAISIDYREDQRVIALHHGQARFTVRKDAARPFVVESDGLAVQALGTVFDVYNRNDAELQVVVQEHAVSVRPIATALEPDVQPVRVDEGQQLLYRNGSGLPAPSKADIGSITAWQQQKLMIDDQPLRLLIDELNRYRVGRIYLADADLADIRVSGVFSLRDTDEAVNNLQNALALKSTQIGPWWVILHR